MQKIFNWTIGSFFRSIGRIFAYLVIGGIISYLLYSNTNFRIIDLLGIQKVSASSFQTADVDYFNNSGNIYSSYNLPGNYQGMTSYLSAGFNTQYVDFNINNTNGVQLPIGSYKAHFQVFLSGSNIVYSTTDNDSSGTITFTDTENVFDGYFTFLLQTDGAWVNCSVSQVVNQNNINNIYDLVCPIANGVNKLTKFNVSYRYTSQQDDYTIVSVVAFSRKIVFEIDEQQATTNAINNQTQVIQDTNSTSESSSASDFFHDYNETSQDGVLAIVNMPLNIFNALTLGSTNDLCFNLKGKRSCLPSGDIIWGKTNRTSIQVGNRTVTPHPFSNGGSLSEPVALFKTLFNLVVGGYLSYKMLKSLMRITNDMLNPTKDKLEVLEL